VLCVVLDVNVLISALLSPQGAPAAVVAAWRGGRFDVVASPMLVREFESVRRRRHVSERVDDHDLAAFFADVARNAILVDDPPPARHVPRDPDDDYLITLALVADAHAIVTGDTALLALALDRPRILTPRDFLAAIESVE